MKDAPPALVTLINASNTFVMADLYDILLANGDRLRYCSDDHPITYPDDLGDVIDPPGTFLPTLGIERSGVEWSCRPEVQNLDVTFFIDDSVTYNGVSLAQAALEGIFDNAAVTLYRAFFGPDRALVDALVHFKGNIADVKPTSHSIQFTVKSELDKLNQKLPRNLYQPPCAHVWLDGGCDPGGTLRTANTVTGALIGTPTRFVMVIPSTYSANNFQLGAIKMTSGPMDGYIRGIRSSVNGGGGHTLTLAVPFPRAPEAGDTFSLITGCDRTLTMCTSRYANEDNFRGFPFVPRPEEQWPTR